MTPDQQRAAADYLAERYGASQRRASRVMCRARSSLRYRRVRRADEPALAREIKRLARRHPRYGYRRIRIFLVRDGYRMSPGRAYRLWRAASLQLPRKRPRKRVAAARPRPQAPRARSGRRCRSE